MSDSDLIQQLFDNFNANPFIGPKANMTPQELAAHDPTGNPQPQGWIGAGAVDDVAAFAATIRPVFLVHGLPALPDSDYPVGQFVYNLDDTPARLYKNEADAWVAAVGPDDIQANSITAGQIAAGAVSTSELAVGARLTGEVANESGLTPGVFIDSSGILIRDGKLTLQDEFGLTVMEASGFSGNWAEFLALGLYNGMFHAGATGTLPTGRTSSLPYWDVVKEVGSPTLTRTADSAYPGGYRVRATFSAINDVVRIASDPVAVIGGSMYALAFSLGSNTSAGEVDFQFQVDYYDADGSFISTDGPFGFAMNSLAAGSRNVATYATAPIAARTAVVKVGFKELTAHSSANYGEIGLAALKPASLGLDNTGDVAYTVFSLTADSLLTALGAFSATDRTRFGGSSFPATVVTDDVFYRTDFGMWFHYDGTRWVCNCPHTQDFVPFHTQPASPLAASVTERWAVALQANQGMNIVVDSAQAIFFVTSGASALSASHKWVGIVERQPDNATVSTLTIDSGASGAYRAVRDDSDALVDIDGTGFQPGLTLSWTKTGTPGDLRFSVSVTYRYTI